MRNNKVKEKLKNGERAYIASGNSHASTLILLEMQQLKLESTEFG